MIENWRDRRLKKWIIKHVPRPPYPTTNANMEYYSLYFDWIKSLR